MATSQRKRWLSALQREDVSKNLGAANDKVVIDTNVWYSAILYGGAPAEVLEHCLQAREIVVSEEIIEELVDALKNDTNAPHRWLRSWRRYMEDNLLVIPARDAIFDVRDPKDNHVLSAAIVAACSCILTGDEDLLALHPFGEIRILKPVDFLK